MDRIAKKDILRCIPEGIDYSESGDMPDKILTAAPACDSDQLTNRITVDDVIELLSILANDQKLEVTVRESMKGAAIAGVGAFIGGLLDGPRGLALGGALGSIGGAYYAWGRFVSVGTILKNMADADKKKLYKKALEIFAKFSIHDVVAIHGALTNSDMRQQLLTAIIDHVERQLHMKIID